jgi:hypothetical protein
MRAKFAEIQGDLRAAVEAMRSKDEQVRQNTGR